MKTITLSEDDIKQAIVNYLASSGHGESFFIKFIFDQELVASGYFTDKYKTILTAEAKNT